MDGLIGLMGTPFWVLYTVSVLVCSWPGPSLEGPRGQLGSTLRMSVPALLSDGEGQGLTRGKEHCRPQLALRTDRTPGLLAVRQGTIPCT